MTSLSEKDIKTLEERWVDFRPRLDQVKKMLTEVTVLKKQQKDEEEPKQQENRIIVEKTKLFLREVCHYFCLCVKNTDKYRNEYKETLLLISDVFTCLLRFVSENCDDASHVELVEVAFTRFFLFLFLFFFFMTFMTFMTFLID